MSIRLCIAFLFLYRFHYFSSEYTHHCILCKAHLCRLVQFLLFSKNSLLLEPLHRLLKV